MSQFYNDSIFWVDVEKIQPNPFQPRREFDQAQLQSLSDSIRQYGVLQALVVTRKEVPKEDGGLAVEYELIAGERRLRASKLAGLSQVPVLIKVGDETNDLLKLELAIIENIQREDLNPVDRARAFQRLIDEFGFKHVEIAKKVGKSREYVSNSVRLLTLPSEMQDALSLGKISEGHARPLMMLGDRPEEQLTLFKEIMFKRLTVREAEAIGRRVAYDKIRKKGAYLDPETQEMEEKLTETLGTRVSIEKRLNGGKILIDFFSEEDLQSILELLKSNKTKSPTEMLDKHIIANPVPPKSEFIPEYVQDSSAMEMTVEDMKNLDDRTPEQKKEEESTEDEIYSIKNFSI
jgi:ParB family transcriptional regulator, chromosome partitioning protein